VKFTAKQNTIVLLFFRLLPRARTGSILTSTGRLQNQHYFQEVYCMYCNTTNYLKTMLCGVTKNSLEITLILQTDP